MNLAHFRRSTACTAPKCHSVGKEPWNFRSEVERAMGEALRLRHQLLPYIYTMNYLAYKEYRPLIAPDVL